ncbi:unnamed protein product [Larinioides sclopetarius]|uniref:Uncharacterized protein n=1 Tax=Larinioides sclopetarius TaxID=280406 RepID=A0AAV1ZDS9_9ARAC
MKEFSCCSNQQGMNSTTDKILHNSTGTEDASLIKEESIVQSFYIEGLIGIIICGSVVFAVICVLLYYIVPWKKSS